MKKLKLAALAGILVLTISASGTMLFSPSASALSGGYSNGSGCTRYSYWQGDYYTCVSYIQRILNAHTSFWAWRGYSNYGYRLSSTILSVDSAFGPMTAAKVQNYQGWSGLGADGIVGPQTWNKLCNDAGYLARYLGSNTDAANAARSAGCVLY